MELEFHNQRKMKDIKALPLLRITKEKRKKGKESQQEEQRNPASKDKEIQQVTAKKSSNAWLKQRGISTLLKYIG